MADAREAAEWDRTSRVLAKIHNAHCARAADILTPAECNPLLQKLVKRSGAVQTSAAFHRAMYESLAKGGR